MIPPVTVESWHSRLIIYAVLVAEKGNRYDADAVAAWVQGHPGRANFPARMRGTTA
jgi:hypothetical protein